MVKLKSFFFAINLRKQLNSRTVFVGLLALAFASPIIAIIYTATGDTDGLWPHLAQTVLPRYLKNTLVLLFGVSLVSLLFGVTTAWIVMRYEFVGRRLLQWMLLLPAAIPGYLIAYTYTDFFEYAGPVQILLRDYFGWSSAREYWFPEIRSMGGAILVLGAVLYPYVYVLARTAFTLTPASLFEVARLSGQSLFWRVAIPLARPSIAAGLALVMMETLSDFGTVEYFAIETISLGIFNVWLGMNSLTAAAQISLLAFLFIIGLPILELFARSRRRFIDTTQRSAPLAAINIKGSGAIICCFICSVPIVIGFAVPVVVLLRFIFQGHSLEIDSAMISAAKNTVFLGLSAACLVIFVASILGMTAAFDKSRTMKVLAGLTSFGYAFPGTILAIGVVTAGGALDENISHVLGSIAGISYDGWLTSGVGLVLCACVIRFQAIGYGAVSTGLQRVSPNMAEASRVLGCGLMQSMRRVMLPSISLSCVAGALLVFVDVMKELPMTLILRPFNYETLATIVYQYAKDELLEEAALPALAIVLCGLIPIILLNKALNRIRRP